MKKTLTLCLLVPLAATLLAFTAGGAARKCHSEIYYAAKAKLQQIVLNDAQKRAIRTYEARFWKQWRETHRKKGCRYHEAHAAEFVAAAAGVLSDKQFVQFQGRQRNAFESLGHELWSTERYVSNLVKIAQAL